MDDETYDRLAGLGRIGNQEDGRGQMSEILRLGTAVLSALLTGNEMDTVAAMLVDSPIVAERTKLIAVKVRLYKLRDSIDDYQIGAKRRK